MQFEYTPEGVPKRKTQTFNKMDNSEITYYTWDSNQKIIDPNRLLFLGYPYYLSLGDYYYTAPLLPLSVKGDLKSSISYNKAGKVIKNADDEPFDIRANTAGLWLESRYKEHDSTNNKETISTMRAVYEGCKN